MSMSGDVENEEVKAPLLATSMASYTSMESCPLPLIDVTTTTPTGGKENKEKKEKENKDKGKRRLKLNQNLILGFTLTGVFSFANNIYATNVFPNFLLEVAGGNTVLFGLAEALSGLSQLVAAFPIGYLADKYKRKYLLWFGGGVWTAYIGLLGYATYYAHRSSMKCFVILCAVLALGGLTNGIVGGPLMALLDDSVEAGFRSDMEMYYSVIWNLASIVGPIVALVSFSVIGNQWNLQEMKFVIFLGCAATIPCVIICFFLDDNKTLGKESDSVIKIEQEQQQQAAQGDSSTKDLEGSPANLEGEKKVLGFIGRKHIPWFLFLQNLFSAIGAGMTVKFFPIFFQVECGLNPVFLQIVYICLPLVVVLGTVLATKLSKKFGRMQIIIPFNILGISLTFTMALMRRWYTLPHVMIPVYLARCGFMWSTGGLAYSIIADYVPKEYRARWNTLESIASFGWSGSALLGGKLVRMSGYSTTFAITAIVQLLGVLLFALPLVPLVAKESDIQALVEDQKESGGTETDELEEPLLGNEARESAEPREIITSSIRGLPGLNPMFNETENENENLPDIASSLSKSLGHLEHIARVGSLG